MHALCQCNPFKKKACRCLLKMDGTEMDQGPMKSMGKALHAFFYNAVSVRRLSDSEKAQSYSYLGMKVQALCVFAWRKETTLDLCMAFGCLLWGGWDEKKKSVTQDPQQAAVSVSSKGPQHATPIFFAILQTCIVRTSMHGWGCRRAPCSPQGAQS